MVWTPNGTSRLGRKRENIQDSRATELRELHPLIADYLDRLVLEPVPLLGTGIPDYFDPETIKRPEDVFERYKVVNPRSIEPRNLARAIQFSMINGMSFPNDTTFNPLFRSLVFSVAKAAAIVEAGHHLSERIRNPFTRPSNNPINPPLKQEALDRFAFRWLDLTLKPDTQELPEGDIDVLHAMFDAVNNDSRGNLANDLKRSLKPDVDTRLILDRDSLH